MTFRLAGQEFAIDAKRVKGIVPLHDMETVERDAADAQWLMGSARVHGRLVQVLDLARWLGLARRAQGRNSYVLAVDRGSDILGFPVDRVCDMVVARARDYSHGKLRIGRPRRVLDADQLFSANEAELESADRPRQFLGPAGGRTPGPQPAPRPASLKE